ncbi:hypothetical protein MPER_01142, partial [Moniliophthora perniciosa FA553]
NPRELLRTQFAFYYSFFRENPIPTIENLGQEVNADVSDGSTKGGAPMQLTVFDGTFNRSYAANSYCKLIDAKTPNLPNRERENLVVLTESLVSKITWGEDQDGLAVANGVEYISANETSTANGKNIIVSSGALNTPKVLELSGIGDPLILNGIGVELKVNNTGVGKNLQNQYGINVRYQLKDGAAEIGDEFQAPLMNLVPAQIVLSPEDLAKSAEILAEP